MTEQHPLTDDKCYELWSGNLYENEKMRAAADWQLAEVIKWLRGHLQDHEYLQIYLIESLAQAMRPNTTQRTTMTKKSEKTATKIQSALERIVLELYVWCNGWYPRAYKDPRISLREIADRAYNVLQQETDQCEPDQASNQT